MGLTRTRQQRATRVQGAGCVAQVNLIEEAAESRGSAEVLTNYNPVESVIHVITNFFLHARKVHVSAAE
jgi:hypothetical protein